MVKLIFSSLLFLLIAGCSEQEATEQNMINIQAAMLKGLCENESTCFNKIDTSAESCRQKTYDLKNFDKLSEMDQMITGGEFVACIIRKMDQSFQDRFDIAMPVTETGVEISRPTKNTNSEIGLLVFVKPNGISIADKSQQVEVIPFNNIKAVIKSRNLDKKYSTVIFIVEKEVNTKDFDKVIEIFKNAGIEKIPTSAKKY